MTTISSLTSLGMFVARHYNAASARADHATKQLVSGSRIITAADDPQAIGRIEQLKSLISENRILNRLAPSSSSALSPVSAQLGSLLTQAQGASGSSDLRALVAALRDATSTEVFDRQVFAGDMENPVTRTVSHPGTSGSLTGESLAPSFSLTRQTLNLTVDGTGHSLRLATGTYTVDSAADAIRTAISEQSSLVLGRDVDVAVDGDRIVVSSLSTGASSSVTAGGGAANELGLSAGVAVTGEDAYTEEVPTGEGGPVHLTYAGREVVFSNLSALADDLESALDSGDASAAESVRSSVVSALGATKGSVDFAVGRLGADSASRDAQNRVYQDELDRLSNVDRTAATLELARSQVQMEQAQWALRQLREGALASNRILFGIE